jgi:NAD(P)-dependent dehydrogenase (short-subunit alcohol dehydrogenase family)
MPDRKTLVLTGASRGIGHATVKHFTAAGWRVLSVSRNAWTSECPWAEGDENHIQMDLADVADVERGIGKIRARLKNGRIEALVNNAGISPKNSGDRRLGVLDTGYDTWLRVFNVNLFSVALLARGLFEELRAGGAAIVNVTSIAGSRVHPFAGSAYATSKAALAAMTREMAHEFGPHGVRANSIAPGEIDTAMLSPGTDEIVRDQIPLHRMGKPEEVAATIYFLCTHGASYINGAEIHVDGGQQA